MGEESLIGALAAGGTTVATGVFLFGRAKLDAALRWLRRR
jgi:hypothetical protein